MLNRIIYSNEGKLKNSIEQTAVKVLETYSYGEMFIPATDDTVETVFDGIKNCLCDEIMPLRIYNINNYGIMFAMSGETNVKAMGEIILLCTNIALANDICDFNISISSDMTEELKNLVEAYEINGYVSFAKAEGFSFKGLCGKKEILKGGRKENGFYAIFDMEALLEILYTDKIKNAVNVPLVLVGSDNLSALHKTAFGLRAKGLTVETFVKNGTMYDAEEYAELKNITIVMWITDEGKIVMKNVKNGEMSETTLDTLLNAAQ